MSPTLNVRTRMYDIAPLVCITACPKHFILLQTVMLMKHFSTLRSQTLHTSTKLDALIASLSRTLRSQTLHTSTKLDALRPSLSRTLRSQTIKPLQI
jgi:hypothetical protein